LTEAKVPEAESTAQLVRQIVETAHRRLSGESQINSILLRSWDELVQLPSFTEIYQRYIEDLIVATIFPLFQCFTNFIREILCALITIRYRDTFDFGPFRVINEGITPF